jgi:hypothetical protein
MFKHFEKDGEFVCYHGQTNKSITAMYNTYRAAQVAFPGESELERANVYCRGFLEEKRASGKFGDKWVIPKDLAGEVPKSKCFMATLSTSPLIKYGHTLHFHIHFGRSATRWTSPGEQACHGSKQGCIWSSMVAVPMCGSGKSSIGDWLINSPPP